MKIRAVVLSGPRGEEGPPFTGGSRWGFQGTFQCNLCGNTLSVPTIMNFLNLCDIDSFGFSFMISKVIELIHSLKLT